MADELPPLADVPDEVINYRGGNAANTQHAAEWADTFGGSDRNLAQRSRHNADIMRHTAAVQDAQKAHFMDSLAADKGKQDLYFRQKTLDATINNREQTLAQREAQFNSKLEAQKQIDSIKGDLAIAQTDLAKTRAEAAATAAKAKMELAASEANDTKALTEAFIADKAAGKFKPGSPEMADWLLTKKAEHPAVGKNTFGALWAGTNINVDPDTYAAKKAQEAATLANTQARTDAAEANALAKTVIPPEKQLASITKEIAAIDKARPAWRGTTGIMKDKNGVERFGFPQDVKVDDRNRGIPFEESLVATPELKADYARYQNLVQKRAAIEGGSETAAAPAARVKRWKFVDGKLVEQ